MRTRELVVALLGLLAWGACSDDAGPEDTVGPEALNIIRQSAAAPPLQAYQASFWAVRGTSRTLEIDYAGPAPGEPGQDFFRLDVPGDALLRRPDGTSFQQGDSVLITVFIDTQLLLFRFEPGGLVFDAGHPARLRVDYAEADDDLNEDGVVDQEDEAIKDLQLSLWRQEQAGDVWVRIGAVHIKDLEEFEAELFRFSNYALGW